MSMANNLEAHQQFLDVWQRALDSPRGIQVNCENPVDYRARLYNARTAERRHNKKVYPADHVLHGKSYYDGLVVRLVRDVKAIRIIKHDAPIIEEITEL
jgi:hypothetical protein